MHCGDESGISVSSDLIEENLLLRLSRLRG